MRTVQTRLRALEPADLDRLHAWHNDPDLYASLGGVFRFVSRSVEEEWLRRRSAASDTEINLAICLRRTGEHIGNLYLRDIDWVHRHGRIEMFIGPRRYRGRGFGTDALRQFVRYVFETLGLHRLYLFVLADHRAAIRAYEKCGFVTEGRLRAHVYKSGAYRDMLVMGLVAPSSHLPKPPR